MSTEAVYVTRVENEEPEDDKYVLSIPHSILLDGLSERDNKENFTWTRYINTRLKGKKYVSCIF